MRYFILKLPTICHLFVISAGVAPALAQECDRQTQRDMNSCADAHFGTANMALTSAYGALASRLKQKPASLAMLAKTQKAWTAWREAECRFTNAGYVEGTIYPMVYALCLERLTQRRIEQVRGYLDCKEDLDCPVPAQ